MDAPWRIELFGELRLQQGERILTRFDTRKTAALLACLALELGRACPREALAEQLWPGEDPLATRDRLKQALSVLRRALEPLPTPAESVLVAARRPDVRLDPRAVTTDVAEFESALRAADRTADPGERRQFLTRAVELYRGELLPGYCEDWIVAARERLAESHLNALRSLAAECEATGDRERALDFARRAAAADPLCELAHQDVIRLSIALGRTSEAMRQYRELERLLRQELDAEPSLATRRLLQERLTGAPAFEALRTEETGVEGSGIRVENNPAPAPYDPTLKPQPSKSKHPNRPPPDDPIAEGPTPNAQGLPSPRGTVTFLLTDVEGSARLWERHPAAMSAAMARHDTLAAQIISRHGGTLLKRRGEGDSLFAVFLSATDAVAAACALQQAFQTEPWPAPTPLRVRIAVNTGEADRRDGDYYGPAVNRCARLRALAHGGQVLLSLATEELVRGTLPPGAGLRDLGEHRLRDLDHPERAFQLLHPALPERFPPLAVGSKPVRRVRSRLLPRWAPLSALFAGFVLILAGLLLRPHLEAYWLCRQARSALNDRSLKGLEEARQLFTRAIQWKPGFAPAHAGLADSYILLAYYSYMAPDEARGKAFAAADQALSLQRDSAEAYTSRAMAGMLFNWDWTAAESDFERAIECDNAYATAQQWYSLYMIVQGRRGESLEAIGRAGGLDVSSRAISKAAASRYYYLGEYDHTIHRSQATIELDPTYSPAYYWLGLALLRKRRFPDAEGALKRAYALSGEASTYEEARERFQGSTTVLASLGHLYAVWGKQDPEKKALAQEILRRLRAARQKQQPYVSPVGIAAIYTGLEEYSRAVEWLEQGLRDKACEMIFIHVDPIFTPLHTNRGFRRILHEIRLPDPLGPNAG